MNILLSWQFLTGSLAIVTTVVFHIAGLVLLARFLKHTSKAALNELSSARLLVILAFSVLVIIIIHTLEAWMWAFIYYSVGEFATLEAAIYFSVVTATTLGYGDITLSEHWRLLSAFEAMGGLLLFGTSTAFLLGLMRHVFDNQVPDTK